MTDQFQINRRTILAGAAIAGALGPIISTTAAWGQGALKKATAAEIAALPREKVELVDPPFVHAHTQVAKGGPKVVEFTMTIEEKKIVIDDDGTEVHAMTFNGTVPGPLMVVHQDDYVELTLINPETNTLMHNIDFHAATGALGGGGRAHGIHDLRIARAHAEVPGELPPDFLLGRVPILDQQRVARHHHARSAKAALKSIVGHKRLLHRVQRPGVCQSCQTLHRRDFPSVGLNGQDLA